MRILKYLEAKAPDNLQDMIATKKFQAFRDAAAYGHLDVINYLKAKAPDKLQAMMTQNDFEAFRKAAENHHFSVTSDLLEHEAVFAYAESLDGEYNELYIQPIITKKLKELHATLDTSLINEEKKRAHLNELLQRINGHNFKCHGGGKKINNKIYSNAALLIRELLIKSLSKNNLSENDYKDIKDKIKNELIKKTQVTYGFFGFFRRDETTVVLYRTLLKEAEKSSFLDLKDRGCAPEVAIFDGVKEGHQGRIPNA